MSHRILWNYFKSLIKQPFHKLYEQRLGSKALSYSILEDNLHSDIPISAMATPDWGPVTMFVLAVPMMLLYELSMLFAKLFK